MKQGDIVELYIRSFGDNAEGVAITNDFVCFVKNALPTETVKARITYVKKNIAYADTLEVLQASPDRAKPLCPYYARCGGCELQHMSYGTQAEFKRTSFEKKMSKIGGVELKAEIYPSSKAFEYRNKIQLPVRSVGGKTRFGFFEKGSHKLVPIKFCPLHGDWATTLITILNEYVEKTDIMPYDEGGSGVLRTAVARYTENQLLLTLVIRRGELPNVELLESLLEKSFEKYGLFVSLNEKDTNVIMGKTTYLFGQKYIEGKTCGLTFRLRPESFFQVNDYMRDALYFKVKELVSSGEPVAVIDCYSGTGVLTALLSSNKHDTYGIEIDSSSVADAIDNVKLNLLSRTEHICGDVTVELPRLLQRYEGQRVSIVCDPARKGISESAVRCIAAVKPYKFVYVSCNSATQARDISLFNECVKGEYQIEFACAYDQFPQTLACESIVSFVKKV